jgi:hypothetical protein
MNQNQKLNMLTKMKRTNQIENILMVIICWQALNVFTDSFLLLFKYTLLNLSTNIKLVFTANIFLKLIFVFLSIYIVQFFIYTDSKSKIIKFSILSFYISSLLLSYYIYEILLYFFNNKTVTFQNNLYNGFLSENITISFLNLYLETIFIIVLVVYFLLMNKKENCQEI